MSRVECECGYCEFIPLEGETIRMFVGVSGKHEVTFPGEDLECNKKTKAIVHAVMQRYSEMNGYFEQEG